MKKFAIALLALVLAACAGTYEPPTSGPTITLRVQPDIKPGVPVLSYSDLVLSLDQMGKTKNPATNDFDVISLGWKKVPTDGPSEPFVVPADKLLRLSLSYSSDQVFGNMLSGRQTYVLLPEAGNSYVMTFWTDDKTFSVKLFKQDRTGQLIPARAFAARED